MCAEDDYAGFTKEELDAMVQEAERGYEVDPSAWRPGPGAVLAYFPQDVRAAVVQRCMATDRLPLEVIEEALVEYLHIMRED
ncbi:MULTISPECIES: hypothetical protein [unclassified Corynebacterium]|uniref:hypothetical protein n=1 Tax=unclassified Corynebacterium TaxID=2624378 RepID=UPI0029C9FA76|nr:MULTISPECIES: hypothetical protein [unclassified Corynebacterium]WPF66051.1 hypothetical protein OLX12_10955 [Corynebacterium sp. 22KM0430]WPF68544.1 hypothetical protein OLW90_10950 [Corynebacterium sp. 21KM1197]